MYDGSSLMLERLQVAVTMVSRSPFTARVSIMVLHCTDFYPSVSSYNMLKNYCLPEAIIILTTYHQKGKTDFFCCHFSCIRLHLLCADGLKGKPSAKTGSEADPDCPALLTTNEETT